MSALLTSPFWRKKLRRCYIILSTSLLITHWGKLCVGVFEIICERFLKCYHDLGNGWHCPEEYFKGFFLSWTIDKLFSIIFWLFFRALCLYFMRHLMPLAALKEHFRDAPWSWTEHYFKTHLSIMTLRMWCFFLIALSCLKDAYVTSVLRSWIPQSDI